ncbi:MAG: aldose 1-epimerase family protein [Ruminococcus sp.]|nr:aldose 1-epimerase family protein [Ruminococcus sp.]
MLYTIKNDQITIKADTFGAELHSVKYNDVEYLWQCGDSWKRYAPVLFPFICSPTGKKYCAKGKEYTMPANHGFARDSEFELLSLTGNSVSFILKSSDKTLEVYPYDFELIVSYILENNKIIVSNLVKNTADDEMYFYVGGHPAFNCPLDEGLEFSDYYVEYEKNESIVQPLNDNKCRTIIDNENKIYLSRELFNFDVIMKDAPESKKITLKSDKDSKSVTVEFPQSDCIAVWSPTGDDNATFVCLEPWTSVPTYADDGDKNIEDKKHAIRLDGKKEFDYRYSIIVE